MLPGVPARTVLAVRQPNGGLRTIVAPAHLGLDSRADFRRAAVELLDALPEGDGVLIVDLSATRLLDSAGLGALMLVRQHAAERRQVVRLRGVNEEIRMLLVLTRLEDLFDLEGSRNASSAPSPHRRVLFIEDEEPLAHAYRRYFESRLSMAFAASGVQAEAQLETFKPEVAVLDMRLPDTDGVDLLRRLRAKQPRLPVIVTTAYASMQPLLGVMGLSHSGFLVKPFELIELEKLIDAIK